MPPNMPSMPKLYWEDFKPGAVAEYGPRLVTREEIVAFAAEFDPQPMHLDEAAARATMLGGLVRLGLAHLLPADAHDRRRLRAQFELDGRARRRRSALARAAPAGRRASACARPCSTARASNSRPDMGFVKFRFELLDAAGERVMTLDHDR